MTFCLRRREFIAGLGGAAAWPLAVTAQQAITTSPPMPDTSQEPPRNVVLFSGHMIDAPGREKPRFPPDKESIAARAIAQALADLGAGPADLGICGGACGAGIGASLVQQGADMTQCIPDTFPILDWSRAPGLGGPFPSFQRDTAGRPHGE
jgi:hypothetical protein